jgi:hypothetical protein
MSAPRRAAVPPAAALVSMTEEIRKRFMVSFFIPSLSRDEP